LVAPPLNYAVQYFRRGSVPPKLLHKDLCVIGPTILLGFQGQREQPSRTVEQPLNLIHARSHTGLMRPPTEAASPIPKDGEPCCQGHHQGGRPDLVEGPRHVPLSPASGRQPTIQHPVPV